MHVAVPVISLGDAVLRGHGIGEVAEDTGLFKGFVVHGYESQGGGLEPLVHVDAHRDALDVLRGDLEVSHILLEFRKGGCLVDIVDILLEVLKSRGGYLHIREGLPHRLDDFDIILQRIQPVHQIPQPQGLVGILPYGAVVPQELDPVEELRHLRPEFRQGQDIGKHLLPVKGHPSVGCHV